MRELLTLKLLLFLSLSSFASFSNALEIDDAFKKLAGVKVVTELSAQAGDETPVEKKSFYLRNLKPNRDFKSDDIDQYFEKHFNLYLQDANYSAHFPTYHEYFSRRLGKEETPNDLSSQIMVEEDGSFRQASLNPAYLYRVDYLLASKGEGMMSGFGHSMVRLVFCDPERSNQNGRIIKDEKCLNDHNFHLVVSFRAQINELSISTLKGIFGGYPSRLFIIPFNQIKKEYNQVEFRDLLSFKMNLSENQKLRFLKRTLELYWTYQNDYKFLSNNCAVEVINLIKSVLWDSKFNIDNSMKPYGVLKELQKKKLITSEALVFFNYEKDYKEYLSYINIISDKNYDLLQYAELGANKRAELTKLAADYVINHERNKKDRIKAISSLLLLEKLVAERAVTKEQGQLPKLVKEGKISSQNLKPMKDFLSLTDNFNLADKNTFGIPTQEQFITLEEFIQKLEVISVKFLDFKKFIINSIPHLQAEIEISNKTLTSLDKIKRTIRSEK